MATYEEIKQRRLEILQERYGHALKQRTRLTLTPTQQTAWNALSRACKELMNENAALVAELASRPMEQK